jgi:Domain of unknown function (DUF4266)
MPIMTSKRKLLYRLLVIVAGLFISSCTPVKPWERGTLAKSYMSLYTNPEQRIFQNHNYSSREATTGGGSAKGGGCGCN